VVDIGVRQKEKIERLGVEAGMIPIPLAELLEPLKHSRVDEKACRVGLDEVARAVTVPAPP